jgi:hypothetical protein
MNWNLIINLPLVGSFSMPLSLALGAVAFTLSMLAFTALIIAGEIDNKRNTEAGKL